MLNPYQLELIEYQEDDGESPFRGWFLDLDLGVQARITSTFTKLRAGNLIAKSVGLGVSELRLDFGPGYRIYVGRDGERLVILLNGGTKKRQQKDIELAQRRWQAYKQSRQKRIKP